MEAVVSISNTETELKPVEEKSVVQETSLIAGHTLGAAFKVLFDVLMNVKEKTTLFKPLLEDIKSTLDSLEPLIEEIEKYKKVLDRPKEELQHFENQRKNGAALVQKCTKLSPWKGYKKCRHSKLACSTSRSTVLFWLDLPLKELKMMLLNNEKVLMLMLISPGGLGKTALATEF